MNINTALGYITDPRHQHGPPWQYSPQRDINKAISYSIDHRDTTDIHMAFSGNWGHRHQHGL